jgi:hypothetical protein
MHGVIAILTAPTPPPPSPLFLQEQKPPKVTTQEASDVGGDGELVSGIVFASIPPVMHYHEHGFIFVKKTHLLFLISHVCHALSEE